MFTMFIRIGLAGLVLLGGALIGSLARADILGGLGEWRGSGSVFGPDGRAEAEFKVALTRSAAGPRSVDTRGKIELASGQVIPFAQKTTLGDDGKFSLDSERGQGAGFCLGAGLCQSYEDRGNSAGAYTVMAIDGPDTIRIVITELDHGRAVRFIRQTLTKH
jgi:hypothetical protein